MPGLEVAGVIEGLGDGAARFAAGDRGMAIVGGAGQAELACVDEDVALPVPAGLEWPAAGGFPEVFTTAHDALYTQCGLGAGERLLVNGAAGGVGVAAVQLAAVGGSRVVASVRSEELRERVAALGAEVVAPADVVDSGPYDVVLELVGAPNLTADLESLATGGRIAVIGVGAGARAEVNLMLLMGKRGRVHGSTLRTRPLHDRTSAAAAVRRHVLPLLDAGRVHVPIAACYPLEDAAAAYARFRAGGKFGKVVLSTGV
jgi:NADPH:quinone reductase-like Zn-dependent oxidoreductase